MKNLTTLIILIFVCNSIHSTPQMGWSPCDSMQAASLINMKNIPTSLEFGIKSISKTLSKEWLNKLEKEPFDTTEFHDLPCEISSGWLVYNSKSPIGKWFKDANIKLPRNRLLLTELTLKRYIKTGILEYDDFLKLILNREKLEFKDVNIYKHKRFINHVYIPKNLNELFSDLDKQLPDSFKEAFVKNNNSIDYHFSFGGYVRNRYGLWVHSRLAVYLVKICYNGNGLFVDGDFLSGDVMALYKKHLLGFKTKQILAETIKQSKENSEKYEKELIEEYNERYN